MRIPQEIPTEHRLITGDSRDLSFIPDHSVHLVVTSPPYWSLKAYPAREAQLGNLTDYSVFMDSLIKVLRECYRVLVPGGRVVCVVGDVCLSRRKHGRHRLVPLHADIVVHCREIGFDNLNPIIWYKIANASYEVQNGSKFLGKPYEPNAIIKDDIEYILMQRKPGAYRSPTEKQRELSRMTRSEYHEWFRQVWTLPGTSTRSHPAPFSVELAYRLIRMFSFVGDTVLDPFAGTGTTAVAAVRAARSSIAIDVEPAYVERARLAVHAEVSSFLVSAEVF
jgi:modification methylase